MSGCGRGLFNTEPFVDAKKDAQGNSVILDTPRMWGYFKDDVDREISRERNGDFAQGRVSWNDFWLKRIRNMSDGSRENSEKYVTYILDARREAGLPDLPGK
jgi:hypothetical protein